MHAATFEAEALPLRPPADAATVESSGDLYATPSMIEPWVLLGSQWTSGHAAGASGEKRLLAAVLADAIGLYLKHARSRTVCGRMLFRDTAAWIETRDAGWLLSFENVCDVLGIEAEQLRARLRVLATSEQAPSWSFDAGRLRIGRGRKVRL